MSTFTIALDGRTDTLDSYASTLDEKTIEKGRQADQDITTADDDSSVLLLIACAVIVAVTQGEYIVDPATVDTA